MNDVKGESEKDANRRAYIEQTSLTNREWIRHYREHASAQDAMARYDDAFRSRLLLGAGAAAVASIGVQAVRFRRHGSLRIHFRRMFAPLGHIVVLTGASCMPFNHSEKRREAAVGYRGMVFACEKLDKELTTLMRSERISESSVSSVSKAYVAIIQEDGRVQGSAVPYPPSWLGHILGTPPTPSMDAAIDSANLLPIRIN